MPRRTALILLAVIVCAIGINTVVAMAARHAGASTTFAPLQLPAYGAFTALGVIAGWIGWRIVRRRSTRPAGVLKVLVPAVVLLSFVPDVALLTLKFIPGATGTGVAGLMVMHLVVVAIAVPGYLLASRPPVGSATLQGVARMPRT
jgi:uncharacterized protein DUF6069